MKINIWYDNLSGADAQRLITVLADFESEAQPTLARTFDSTPSAPVPASALDETPAPKRGRPRKEPAVVQSGVSREALIAKLREAVKVNYEACEAWLLRWASIPTRYWPTLATRRSVSRP